MKKNNLVIMLLTLLSLVGGIAKGQSTLPEIKKAIEGNNALYFKAFANNKQSIFVSLYTEDCWIMPPGAPSLCGPDAPVDFFKKVYDLGLRNGEFLSIDVYGVRRDVVAEVGFWKSINAEKEVYDSGKYLKLWKKTKQGWKIWRESFSSDTE